MNEVVEYLSGGGGAAHGESERGGRVEQTVVTQDCQRLHLRDGVVGRHAETNTTNN